MFHEQEQLCMIFLYKLIMIFVFFVFSIKFISNNRFHIFNSGFNQTLNLFDIIILIHKNIM